MSSSYPADEFENPDQSAPVGAHRRPPSRWRPVLPFLLILILVPLLAWGFTYLLQRQDSNLLDNLTHQSGAQSAQSQEQPRQTEAPQSSEAPMSSPTATPEQTPEQTPSESPTPTPTPAEVDRSAPVQVLNTTDIQGYAAQVAGYLSSDGFSSVSAGNTSGWITQENTVFYSTEDEEATAMRIAELTGIGSVRMDTEATGGSGIVVLLVN